MSINRYLDTLPRDIVRGRSWPAVAVSRRLSIFAGITLGDLMLRNSCPDIVHETYFSPFRLGPGRAKRVVTIHDMIHEKFPEYFPDADRMARYKARAVERADRVICVSEATRRDAMEIMRVPSEKITVIHHGFSLRGSKEVAASIIPQLPANPFLLYVGHRSGYKNFQQLINVIGNSLFLRSNFKLICFGGGTFNDHERAAMAKLRLGDGQVIHMQGDDDVLSALYTGARAFIYPSLYEGFGIPPLEAMLHNCPVVCSNTSSIPEVVFDAGEYVDPYEEESVRLGIELVVTSEARRNELIEAGRKRLGAFSWDKCAEETHDVYRELV
jgi:glycosyltransferase involved in cell wall biosynthesis